MIRFSLLLLFLGIGAIAHGYEEFQLTRASTAEPVKVELAEIEAGKAPTSSHVTLGTHWSVYPRSIYTYMRDKGDTSQPVSGTSINHVFYPVISESHPYFKALHELEQQFGGIDKIPAEKLPKLDTFSMLIRTDRYSMVYGIPTNWAKETGPTGLIINDVSPLSDLEIGLLRRSFPKFNAYTVLVLQDGRHPSPYTYIAGMFVIGPVLMFLALAVFVRRSR